MKKKLTKEEIFNRKHKEKLGYDNTIGTGVKAKYPKTKKARTKSQHKRKACICGAHSIPGYKEKKKYPKWKKKSRKVRKVD